MTKISVVIPTCNRPEMLERALASVYSQTVKPFEVIVIDDSLTRNGPSWARNRGIEKANGDWLAFLDDDDVWLPEKLETQINEIKLYTGFKMFTSLCKLNTGEQLAPYFSEINFRHILTNCVILPSTVLISRHVFNDVGLFNENLRASEDFELFLRISANYRIFMSDNILAIKYNGHEQLTSNVTDASIWRIQPLLELLKSGKITVEQGIMAERYVNELLP